MNITMIGTGYVGLVTGACLADMGNEVLCIDVDESKIERLLHGEIPIHEPGLDKVVHRNVAAGRLRFSADPKEGALFGVIQMIAVGTPPDEDGSADLSYVLQLQGASPVTWTGTGVSSISRLYPLELATKFKRLLQKS